MKKSTLLCLLVLGCSTLLAPYNSKLEEKLSEGMGLFGSRFLYMSYTSIGGISDGWTYNVYKPEDAKSIIQTSIAFLEQAIDFWKTAKDYSIPEGDFNTYQEMSSIADDLKAEGQCMIQYIETRKQEDLDRFEQFRVNAWKKIEKLMDIK